MNAAQIANGVTIRTMQSITNGHHDGSSHTAWIWLVISFAVVAYIIWKGSR